MVHKITSDLDLVDYSQPAQKIAHVAVVVGVILIVLSGMKVFGPIGRPGFTATITTGTAFVCLSNGYMLWVGNVNRKEKKYHEQREHFRNAAKDRMERKPLATSFKYPDWQDKETRVTAKNAFLQFRFRNIHKDPSIHLFGGDEHDCLITDKIPGILFKTLIGNQQDMQDYVELHEKARKICESNDLYLLYVPKCKLVDFCPTIAMEEKLSLIGSRNSQHACYQWVMHDPHLQTYSKELLRQFTLFICLMELSDFHYENDMLIQDGRLAILDLDQRGALNGLRRLFPILPPTWFDEFIDIPRKYLSDDDFYTLRKDLPNLRAKAEKQAEFIKQISDFYAKKKITVPTQPLTFNKELFKKYTPEVIFFAEIAIQHLNEKINTLPHLSLIVGRTISLEFDPWDPFFRAIVNDPSNKITKEDFEKVAKDSTLALQETGTIFSYEFENGNIAIVC